MKDTRKYVGLDVKQEKIYSRACDKGVGRAIASWTVRQAKGNLVERLHFNLSDGLPFAPEGACTAAELAYDLEPLAAATSQAHRTQRGKRPPVTEIN